MLNPLVPWSAFLMGTPSLPEFYWNVKSAEQRWKHICMVLHKLVNYSDELAKDLNLTHDAINELEEQFQQFKDGEMLEFYEQQIAAWIDANMERIIQKSISHVYFGISEDGHWCAYIPDSWSDIQFDYGAVYGRSDYMRLILRMNVDSPNVIDNTYSYSLNASPSDFQQLIRDLEVTTRRGDASYETLFTNMGEEISNGNF